MVEESPEKERERHVLATLPIIVKWIEEDKELSEEDFRILKKMYPEQYHYALEVSLDELIEMNTRYRDSKIYRKQVEILLSDRGLKWLRKNYENLLRFGKGR